MYRGLLHYSLLVFRKYIRFTVLTMEGRQFCVVEFVRPPILAFDHIVVVPKTWIIIPDTDGSTDLQTRYPFPPGSVKRLVRNYAKWKHNWGIHDVRLIHVTDSYEDAESNVQKLLLQGSNGSRSTSQPNSHSNELPGPSSATTSHGHPGTTKKQSRAGNNDRIQRKPKPANKMVSFTAPKECHAHTGSSDNYYGALSMNDENTILIKTVKDDVQNLQQYMSGQFDRLFPLIEEMKADISQNSRTILNLEQNLSHVTRLSYLIAKFTKLVNVASVFTDKQQGSQDMQQPDPLENSDATDVAEYSAKESNMDSGSSGRKSKKDETKNVTSIKNPVLITSNDKILPVEAIDKEDNLRNTTEVNNTSGIEDPKTQEDTIILSDNEEDTTASDIGPDNNISAQITEGTHRVGKGMKRQLSAEVDDRLPKKGRHPNNIYDYNPRNETLPAVVEAAPRSVEIATSRVEIAPRRVEPAPSSVETTPSSVETAQVSDETAPRSIETAPRSVETAQRNVETEPRSIETEPRFSGSILENSREVTILSLLSIMAGLRSRYQ